MTAFYKEFMQKFFEILWTWPKSYITGVDLHHILDKSRDSRQGIIKRSIQAGYLIPLKRDLFLIKKPNGTPPDFFEVAAIIYGPSYISFESSLSFHGWIPEAVRTITSATVKRANEFETPVVFFTYSRIPIEIFSFGVQQVTRGNHNIFIASPIKAIADMIYARKRIWNSLVDLMEDLRIERDSFESPDKETLLDLSNHYPSARVRNTLNTFYKELSS